MSYPDDFPKTVNHFEDQISPREGTGGYRGGLGLRIFQSLRSEPPARHDQSEVGNDQRSESEGPGISFSLSPVKRNDVNQKECDQNTGHLGQTECRQFAAEERPGWDFSATTVVNNSDGTAAGKVMKMTGDRGVDVAIEVLVVEYHFDPSSGGYRDHTHAFENRRVRKNQACQAHHAPLCIESSDAGLRNVRQCGEATRTQGHHHERPG